MPNHLRSLAHPVKNNRATCWGFSLLAHLLIVFLFSFIAFEGQGMTQPIVLAGMQDTIMPGYVLTESEPRPVFESIDLVDADHSSERCPGLEDFDSVDAIGSPALILRENMVRGCVTDSTIEVSTLEHAERLFHDDRNQTYFAGIQMEDCPVHGKGKGSMQCGNDRASRCRCYNLFRKFAR